ILAAGIIFIEAHTAVALYAAVHFVVEERAEVLVAVGTFGKTVIAVAVAGHHRHVLQMAGAAFITNGAVMWMIGHQPADDMFPESCRLTIVYGYTHIIPHRFHAAHHDPAFFIIFILEYFD